MTVVARLRGAAARLPIRWRLALGVALTALSILVLIDVAVVRRTEQHLIGLLDDALREESGEMAALITADRPIADLSRLVHDDESATPLLLQAFDGSGGLVGATPAADGVILLPDGVDSASGTPESVALDRVGRVRLLAFPATIDGEPYTLVAAVSFAETAETLAALRRRLGAWTVLGAALSGALAYGLAAAALRPVERMRRRALEIRASSPGVRLPLPAAEDEVRRLGETLNHTLDDIESAAARRRMFVAHASHELRTPLTRLRASLELAGRPQRTTEELRAAVADAAVDTEELIVLAEGLLDLGRLEAVPVRRPAPPCEVSAVARAVAGTTPGVAVVDPAPAWARIEPDALRRVLLNLVGNAEVHGAPPVEIEVSGGAEWVTVVVRDCGPGMEEGFAAVAFEPFTRSPGAADRPGAGMGLAIVAAIVDRHGGRCRIEFEGRPFGVRIDLPVATAPGGSPRAVAAPVTAVR